MILFENEAREEIKQLMFHLPQEKNKGRKLEQTWEQSSILFYEEIGDIMKGK